MSTTEQKLCVIWRGEQDVNFFFFNENVNFSTFHLISKRSSPHTRERLLQEPFGSSKHKFGACYWRTTVTLKKMLETAFPVVDVILKNYPPPPAALESLLPKVAPVAQMGVTVLIVGVEHIFPMIKIFEHPAWYYSLRANSMYGHEDGSPYRIRELKSRLLLQPHYLSPNHTSRNQSTSDYTLPVHQTSDHKAAEQKTPDHNSLDHNSAVSEIHAPPDPYAPQINQDVKIEEDVYDGSQLPVVSQYELQQHAPVSSDHKKTSAAPTIVSSPPHNLSDHYSLPNHTSRNHSPPDHTSPIHPTFLPLLVA
ncbi:hypothetical protein Bca52824_001543 [Brassica carinata]|uniref:Uncharacterized protein n=1 Tax=Brassica carinata TaxID=52824 RepID=A0A8X7WGA1_BRACI|nr:hypothetical protein Bca52824_001543 [Brassica carinata]